MKILHISDTHIGSREFFDEQRLLSIIESINKSDYDLVVHSGDVTQSGRKEEFREAAHFLDDIQKPLIVIPGNHDTRSGGLYLFEQCIGRTNGYYETDDAVVIYINSAIADSDDGRVGRVQFGMLREVLHTFQHKAIKILVIHHHLLPIPMSGRERNVLYNAGDILQMVFRTDIDLVLLGHKHYPNIYKVEDKVFANAGTVSGKKTRYGDVNSYNEIVIDKETTEVSIRRADGDVIRKTYPRKEKRLFSDFGERKMRIVHLSNSLVSEERVFLKKHLRNALHSIEEYDPDLIVHCGGVVYEGVQQDYDLARHYFQNIFPKTFFTPAGRDINYFGYHLFPDYFGEMDQTYSDDYVLCAGVSSAQYDSPIGTVGNTERKSLLNRIEAAEAPVKIVFLHHNIVPIPHSRNKGLLEDSGDLLRDVVDAGTDIILTGTSSHPFAVQVEKTLVVNANSVSGIYQRSARGNSYNMIDIYDKAIAVFEVNSLWGKRRLLGIWERRR